MKNRKFRVETLEERTLLAVAAGGVEEAVAFPAPTESTTWIVNTVEDPTDWDTTDDILSLREAINHAASGDTIKFDPILSDGWIILNGKQLGISKAITIDASETGGITLDANVSNRIFYVSGGTSDNPVKLIGLSVIGGKVKSGNGGGIYNKGELELVDCSVLGNTADQGGGIANYKTLNMIDCTVLGNYGDGILNSSSASILNLDNCIVSENSSIGIYNNEGIINLVNVDILRNTGDGINSRDGALTLTGCSISENSGHGIMSYSTAITMTNCHVSQNHNGVSCSKIITNPEVILSFKDCIISGNESNQEGGGIYNNGNKSFTLTNCAITSNTSKNHGGGIYSTGTIAMINCVVAENSSSTYGGGIYSNGTVRLTNCTVVNNSAISNGSYGGGIYKQGLAYFFNTIVLFNSAKKAGSDIYNASDSTYGYSSITTFTDWTVSSNCPEYDSDQPLFVDAENGNYDLPGDSQAVNNGKNSYILNYPTDVAGNERISGEIVDIGAYEYQFEEPPVETLDPPSILTGSKGVYVSYGANRHQIRWNAVENAVGYELTYTSVNSDGCTSITTSETGAVIIGLILGDEVSYRVRALGEGSYTDSDWSAEKTFLVCPMDINNDGDISGVDRSLMATAWGMEIGDEKYHFYTDINGDGDTSGLDRSYLLYNWGLEADDEYLVYPRPLAADMVFAEFESGDLGVELDVF